MSAQKTILFAFILMNVNFAKGTPLYQIINQKAYYSILKSGSIDAIDAEITLINRVATSDKNAYVGTLLMKKAGMVAVAKEKLHLFKAGRTQLETALAVDSSNVEYHFLRLIIEEHAPKIVKYRSLLESDGRYIRQYFKKLSPELQREVLDYAKTSKVLTYDDLKTQAE